MTDDLANSTPVHATPEPKLPADPTSRLTRRALALGAFGTAILGGGAAGAQSTKEQKKQAAKDRKAEAETEKEAIKYAAKVGPTVTLSYDYGETFDQHSCIMPLSASGLYPNRTYRWEAWVGATLIMSGTGRTNIHGHWVEPQVLDLGWGADGDWSEVRILDGKKVVGVSNLEYCRIPDAG